jgi:hypothetical protein
VSNWQELLLLLRRYYITTPLEKEPKGQKMILEVMKERLPHVLLPFKELGQLESAVDTREAAIQKLIDSSDETDNSQKQLLRDAAMQLVTFEDTLDMILDDKLQLPPGVKVDPLVVHSAKWNTEVGYWLLDKLPGSHAYHKYMIKAPASVQEGARPKPKHYDDRTSEVKHELRFLLSAQCQSSKTGEPTVMNSLMRPTCY